MTNDLNTLNGSLQQMIDELETNLQLMGVNATYDSTTGIRGLIAQITDIEASVGGIDVVTALSCELSETNITYNDNITISGILEADKDDTSSTNVDLEGYLKGATIKIYHDETLIGTAITNGNGEYSFNYNNITMMGTNNIYCVFEGTNEYQECTSSLIPLTVNNDLIVTSTKDILSYADNDSTILTATLIGGDVEGKSVVFKNGDTVLDTVQTDSNGVAEYEYTSQGVGDVSINIECMLLQETYEVQDCFLYDTTVHSSNHDYNLQLPSSQYTLEFDILKKTNANYSKSTGGVIIGEDSSTSYFMIGSGSETNYYISRWGTNVSFTNLTLLTQNIWKSVKCEINGTSADIIIDRVTYSVTGISADTSKLSRVNCNSNNLNVRNIKIKPL